MKIGSLSLVATPIGNYGDITLRALETLESCDAIICEEFRIASTLLKKIGISPRPFLQLNEHNEAEAAEEIIIHMLNGKRLALISDAGTPGFADPGTHLIRRCLELQIPVHSLPGPSSLMTAISLSPLPMDEFFFAGFLPRKENERKEKILNLRKADVTLILMDTPYRLSKLLEEVKNTFGPRQRITLALDLTLESEGLFHGPVVQIIQETGNRKGEFILIVHRKE